jgi:Zn-dependent oligopeptidase
MTVLEVNQRFDCGISSGVAGGGSPTPTANVCNSNCSNKQLDSNRTTTQSNPDEASRSAVGSDAAGAQLDAAKAARPAVGYNRPDRATVNADVAEPKPTDVGIEHLRFDLTVTEIRGLAAEIVLCLTAAHNRVAALLPRTPAPPVSATSTATAAAAAAAATATETAPRAVAPAIFCGGAAEGSPSGASATAAAAAAALNWGEVCGVLAEAEATCSPLKTMVTFPMHVSESKEMRDCCKQCCVELDEFEAELSSHEDVFRVLKAYSESTEGRALSGERRRYLDLTLRDYRRNGVELLPNKRERLQVIRKRMAALNVRFTSNLAEDDTSFWFTDKQLSGVPDDVKKQFKRAPAPNAEGLDRYIVTLRYPHYFPVMAHCSCPQTRSTMERAFTSLCQDSNAPILEELVQLRAECSGLLGYRSWAEYVTEVRMAKTPEAVREFVRELTEKFQPLLQSELRSLTALKHLETGHSNEPLHMYDVAYYTRMREEKEFAVDREQIKRYFPLPAVIRGALRIYQHILGLRFTIAPATNPKNAVIQPKALAHKTPDETRREAPGENEGFVEYYARTGRLLSKLYKPGDGNRLNQLHLEQLAFLKGTPETANSAPAAPAAPALSAAAWTAESVFLSALRAMPDDWGDLKSGVSSGLWHEEAQRYDVWDTASGAAVGSFVLDLHPRKGKYTHAACFRLQDGCTLPDGGRQLPVAACVCNFARAAEGSTQPPLLLHSEVVTFFHEFGHVMHHLCSYTEFSRFTGLEVERDFVEAPSQMLENWCYEKAAMDLMSAHVDDKSTLPQELLNRIRAAKVATAGYTNTRQLVLATFDQLIHDPHLQVHGPRVSDRQGGGGPGGGGVVGLEARPIKDCFDSTWEKLIGIPVSPLSDFAATFGHLASGYAAQVYGYLWAESISADMFATRFKGAKHGVLDLIAGMDYRRTILEPGSSRDANDSVVRFLGRPTNSAAFLISKGLKPTTTN